MFKSIKTAASAVFMTALFVVAANAQTTTGIVNMSGTVSKFVEIQSNGAITLAGNSGGGVTTDGTLNTALAAVVDLGELGPSNASSFVTATVPLKLRSNAAYVLSMNATEFRTTASKMRSPLSRVAAAAFPVTPPVAAVRAANSSGVDFSSTLLHP